MTCLLRSVHNTTAHVFLVTVSAFPLDFKFITQILFVFFYFSFFVYIKAVRNGNIKKLNKFCYPKNRVFDFESSHHISFIEQNCATVKLDESDLSKRRQVSKYKSFLFYHFFLSKHLFSKLKTNRFGFLRCACNYLL